MHPYILNQNKVFRLIQEDGFVGYGEHTVPEMKPFIQWTGPRIPLTVWQELCAFFEWSYQEHKAEAQVRLYCNLETNQWLAWAFPQRCIGMTTEEIGDHADWAANEQAIPQGFICLGTVHHHCSSSAFQSGTDSMSERHNPNSRTNGIHITVGRIGSTKYDIHARVILNKNQDDADLHQWFEVPQEWALPTQLPAPIQSQVSAALVVYMLATPPPADYAFPEVWKENVHKAVYANQYTGPVHVSHSNVHGVSGADDWPKGEHSSKYPAYAPQSNGHHGHHGNYGHYDSAYKGPSSGPFAASAGSTVKPGTGAVTPTKGETEPEPTNIKGRVVRALKNIQLAKPDENEIEFLKDVSQSAFTLCIEESRILELVCMLLANEPHLLNELNAAAYERDSLAGLHGGSDNFCGGVD